MRKAFLILLGSLCSLELFGQGFDHIWLLGTDTGFPMGRMEINSNFYTLVQAQRKMTFKGTEATISDANGNFLMSSNGVWIANANNDTMMNGSGLNPSSFTSTWPLGIPLDYGNIILPFPGDSNKYVLIHKTIWGSSSISPKAIYKSVIDITLDNGLGGVIQKNDTIVSDTLSWGIGACKHANGRDWWVVFMRDGNPEAYTLLLTPNGIDTMFTQFLGFAANYYGNVSPIIFSPNGEKMIYCTPINQTQNGYVLLSDFDRCSGLISNTQSIQVSNNEYLFGLAFSSSGKYLYACTSNYIFQIDADSLTIDTVATYDGFCFPNPPWCTTFWSIYLAANGKIYVTSGSAVQHVHEMNSPDSAGLACDVQQHSIYLGGIWYLRAVPNHPNYYLGCDSTLGCVCLNTSVNEISQHDFHFSVSPNPNDGNFKISYLLPQNQSGTFEMFDVNGRKVYEQALPKWSTMQLVSLANIKSSIYNCVISTESKIINRKVSIVKN